MPQGLPILAQAGFEAAKIGLEKQRVQGANFANLLQAKQLLEQAKAARANEQLREGELSQRIREFEAPQVVGQTTLASPEGSIRGLSVYNRAFGEAGFVPLGEAVVRPGASQRTFGEEQKLEQMRADIEVDKRRQIEEEKTRQDRTRKLNQLENTLTALIPKQSVQTWGLFLESAKVQFGEDFMDQLADLGLLPSLVQNFQAGKMPIIAKDDRFFSHNTILEWADIPAKTTLEGVQAERNDPSLGELKKKPEEVRYKLAIGDKEEVLSSKELFDYYNQIYKAGSFTGSYDQFVDHLQNQLKVLTIEQPKKTSSVKPYSGEEQLNV